MKKRIKRMTQTHWSNRAAFVLLGAFLTLPVAGCAVDAAPDSRGEDTTVRPAPMPSDPSEAASDNSTTTANIGFKGPRRQQRAMGDGTEPNPSPWTEGPSDEPNPSPWNGGSNGGGANQDPHHLPAMLSKIPLP